eukprot:TRINITY_DN24122_c0_g1_i1.p1 TRINITY_DN24122_c0_g1~~TRINITY_DN24122_c0_g1_i1.p1  ORF type:complete len:230 (+),score=49.66 TRINITY_DN24122_c0_g1_i1:301-990(+)
MLAPVRQAYKQQCDPTQALKMASYMQHLFPLMGLTGAKRKTMDRQLGQQVLQTLGHAWPSQEELDAFLRLCWDQPEREFQYFGIEFARLCSKKIELEPVMFLETTKAMLTQKSWWDTVDMISSNLVGHAVLLRREQGAQRMDEWALDSNLWLRRAALIHQLKYGKGTDEAQLFRLCLQLSHEPNFFIRKAIGWGLRQHSKCSPAEVKQFLDKHRSQLAPLSIKEASKYL